MRGDGARITSEVGRLETVVCHTPGAELLAVTPSTRADFLYTDIIDLEQSRREHQRFKALLSRFANVLEVRTLLESIADEPEVREFLIRRVVDVAQSERLGRELREMPARDLVSQFVEGRPVDQGPLQRALNVPSYHLPPLPNLFFTRDAAMVVGDGVVIGSMRYTARWTEEIVLKTLFAHHPDLANNGVIYDGSEERRAGYTLEGGDVHVVREDLVVMGLSERSSPSAFDEIAERLVREQGIRDILAVAIPLDRSMIHLDMVYSQVDTEQCVVFPPTFTGPTRCPVLHYRAGRAGMREMPDLFTALGELGVKMEPIFCGGPERRFQEREQWSSGCNFVAVRPGVVLGYARNEHTCEAMRRDGGYRIVDGMRFLTGEEEVREGERAVIVFDGAELVRGGGGPRCMTLPVRRSDP